MNNVKTEPRGLTLIEIVITVAIVLIVSAIAIPALLDVLPRIRVNNAANMIKNDILWARMKAVAANNNYIIAFGENGPDLSNNSYAIYDDSDNNFKSAGAETGELVRSISIPVMEKGIVFGYAANVKKTNNSSDLTGDAVTFSTGNATHPKYLKMKPNGLPAISGTIYITPEKDITDGRKDRMRAVQVLNSGRIKIWKYTNNSWQ